MISSDESSGEVLFWSPLSCADAGAVRNIVIDSLNLKKLVLMGRGTSFNSCVENLRAPNFLSLRVLEGIHADFRLDHMSSLVEAKLDLYIETDDGWSFSVGCDLLKELLEKLRKVPTITIGSWCLKFELDEESKERYNFDEDFLCSQKGRFECLAKHLKRVEIIGCEDSLGWKHVLTLIRFLMGDALVLEKLIIDSELLTRHGTKHLQAAVLSKLLGVFQNVLSYRRASENAKVTLDYPLELVSS